MVLDVDYIFLASKSPRRAELLQQIGVCFKTIPVRVDESVLPGEDPTACAQRLAQAKTQAALDSLGVGIKQAILAADTLVVADGTILGKPVDQAEGISMLEALSGRSHQVISAVCLWCNNEMHSALSKSVVKFRAINADEAIRYWQTGEPVDKAGGYAIQGRAALFIERLEGSYSGVMGLPLFETGALIRAAGLRIL